MSTGCRQTPPVHSQLTLPTHTPLRRFCSSLKPTGALRATGEPRCEEVNSLQQPTGGLGPPSRGFIMVCCASGGFDFFFFFHCTTHPHRLVTCLMAELGLEEASSSGSLKLSLKNGGSLLSTALPRVPSKAVQHAGNTLRTALERQRSTKATDAGELPPHLNWDPTGTILARTGPQSSGSTRSGKPNSSDATLPFTEVNAPLSPEDL